MSNHSIYFCTGNSDSIAMGTGPEARRLSRTLLSTGRERGYYVVVERIHGPYADGRLVWHERCRTGGEHVHGYVSATWAAEQVAS